MEFEKALKDYYKKISTQLFNSTDEAKIQSAKSFRDIFNRVKFDLRGTENLPSKAGVVFIYNHISNNDYYSVDGNFQITLDSHFISSMISYNYYKTPGIRVVRYALPSEKAHKNYYNKFDYIKIYSELFLPENISKEEITKVKYSFYEASRLALLKGENLILNPEGRSMSTEASPINFKAGVFKMIIRSKMDPLIIPLVMTNFDKLSSETIYRCEIKKPFRLSEVIENFDDRSQISAFLISISKKYKNWVTELKTIKVGYQKEIAQLNKIKVNHLPKNKLVVFYGSSTFRLWKNLKYDFDPFNVLNFGFGGSYIEDCITYFDTLFSAINPSALVLYVGGNDLSLDYSPEKIMELYKKLLNLIKYKFPDISIFGVSIKPSIHREDKIDKIKHLNMLMEKELASGQNTFYVNIFDAFLDPKGEVITDYFLIDNLHLTEKGYRIWKNKIYTSIQNKLGYS